MERVNKHQFHFNLAKLQLLAERYADSDRWDMVRTIAKIISEASDKQISELKL